MNNPNSQTTYHALGCKCWECVGLGKAIYASQPREFPPMNHTIYELSDAERTTMKKLIDMGLVVTIGERDRQSGPADLLPGLKAALEIAEKYLPTNDAIRFLRNDIKDAILKNAAPQVLPLNMQCRESRSEPARASSEAGAEPQWTPTYLGDNSWQCAEPPCWILVDDALHPDREPWKTYWDGTGYPLSCTSYRIIGFYRTPLPPAARSVATEDDGK